MRRARLSFWSASQTNNLAHYQKLDSRSRGCFLTLWRLLRGALCLPPPSSRIPTTSPGSCASALDARVRTREQLKEVARPVCSNQLISDAAGDAGTISPSRAAAHLFARCPANAHARRDNRRVIQPCRCHSRLCVESGASGPRQSLWRAAT